ncbi:MAG: hypothetical protein KC931_07120 [Candidatus Omnitrophica bacterium]|nr:hypothetical protein [Candidatus Omnitrophota bacterium]MCA9427274.1 hypothetical protein [Candidatus Omnitrophota bacterium]MCA9431346.1 hypothetical protein [Candidatus Omnitrophota bacterium]MCA9437611.1 hypothetical protein [Candidatus Omnitrophota bacterium]MCA9446867.1 hypothetical protein [Candidatus Omnitrophota bacterium]
MPLKTNRWFARKWLLVMLPIAGALIGVPTVQGQSSVNAIPTPIVQTLIQQWAQALVRQDMKTLETYYADPMMVHTWRQRLAARKPLQVNLLAVHEVRPATGQSWGGEPLSGEAVFTVEYWLQGIDKPLNETRVWGLTNANGYLQIASDIKRKDPLIAPRKVEQGSFPQLGQDPSTTVQLVEPLPQATPLVPQAETQPVAAPTPTPKDAPIPKAELVDQLWNTLLVKFKKAYEYRNERLFLDLFPRRPNQALETFRDNLSGRSWIQVTELAIDADSVKGNRLNSTFRFRYSLWGAGMEKDKIVEVDCAAIFDGSRWQFAKFGDEVIVPPRRTNPPLPDSIVQPLLGQQQNQGFFGNLFGN